MAIGLSSLENLVECALTKMCLLCLQCSPSHHHSTSETSTDDPTAQLGGAFWGLESGVESNYGHKSTEPAASTRNLPQKPVLIYQLPNGEYVRIHDIAICEDGEVYITSNIGVKVYSTAGVYTHTLTQNADGSGIAELQGSKLAISFESDRIVKVFSKDRSNIHKVAAGHGGAGRMALLHSGALAVCYPDEKCVRVFKDCKKRAKVVSVIRRFTFERSKQQPTPRLHNQELAYPWHLTAHGENGLIVSDLWANAVYAFTARKKGEYTCQWMYGGEQGIDTGMLNTQFGVATDSQGRVLIADRDNNRVVLLSHDGEMLMELLTREDGLDCPYIYPSKHKTFVLCLQNILPNIFEILLKMFINIKTFCLKIITIMFLIIFLSFFWSALINAFLNDTYWYFMLFKKPKVLNQCQ